MHKNLRKYSLMAHMAMALLLSGYSCSNTTEKNAAAPAPKQTKTLTSPPASGQKDLQKRALVGARIKRYLENYHYRGLKVDNEVSRKAFDEFIKKIDYGKQFLLSSEVRSLRQKHSKKFDDYMTEGKIPVLNESLYMVHKKIKDIETFREEIFKKTFSFDIKESFELDPDKRKFSKNDKELKEHWRKVFKQATLHRYLSYLDNPKLAEKKSSSKKKAKKKKSKKKKEVILSNKEKQNLLKKAHEKVAKKYKDFLHRMEKETLNDYAEYYFNSISTIFDPHTVYFPPKKKEDFDIEIQGSLQGIGAVLSEDGAFIKVVTVVPGGAAWRQKDLKVDDVILSVRQEKGEPVDIVDMRVDEAVRYIRGKKGTKVTLHVRRPDGSKKHITITRDIVNLSDSVTKSSVLEHKKIKGFKVGYIKVPKFYRDFRDATKPNSSGDVRKEIRRLKKKGIQGIVLDFRNNGGGSLEDARIMSGLFYKTGPVVQIKDHTGNINILSDDDETVEYDGPVVVLINRFSASASEIVAAALQDYKRAVVVGGEFSHGKGTVQTIIDVNSQTIMNLFDSALGAFKITVQKFYRISGDSTQYRGVTPDIIIPDPYGLGKNREQDLDHSLPWDEVRPLKYKKQTLPVSIKKLRAKSQKRVNKNPRFKKIKDKVAYLEKRREDTSSSLHLKTVKAEEEKAKKMAEKFDEVEVSKDLAVSAFEESLKSAEHVKKQDLKKWKEDFKQRKTEWVESLQSDVGLEEALFIVKDMTK